MTRIAWKTICVESVLCHQHFKVMAFYIFIKPETHTHQPVSGNIFWLQPSVFCGVFCRVAHHNWGSWLTLYKISQPWVPSPHDHISSSLWMNCSSVVFNSWMNGRKVGSCLLAQFSGSCQVYLIIWWGFKIITGSRLFLALL